MKLNNVVLTIFCYLSVAAEPEYRTYVFEADLPSEQLSIAESRRHFKIIGSLTGRVSDIHIFSINKTSGTILFSIKSDVRELKKFGEPTDAERLAGFVYGWVTDYKLTPTRFQLNAPPAPPSSLIANDIGTHSVNIIWKRPKFAKVDYYTVQLSSTLRNDSWANFTTINGNIESAKLQGLKPDTEYLIRMESTNTYGTGERKSNKLKIKTKIPSGNHTISASELSSSPNVLRTVVVVVVACSVATVALCIAYCFWRKKSNNPYKESIPDIPFKSIYSRGNRIFCPRGNFDLVDKEDPDFSWIEMVRENLILDHVLGEGEFGQVFKATLKDEKSENISIVAVKTVKGIASVEGKKELFKELKLMAEIGEHPNVVNLLGACSQRGPLWVVVEFCEHGNLLSYLQRSRHESKKDSSFTSSIDFVVRARLAWDISKGMSFLETERIVHRDLAARNVLLGKNKIAKIADFGLSRDIYQLGLYQKATGGKLPVKWMAIESLQEATYTSKSDVWSFGVLCWEIESAGMSELMLSQGKQQ